MEKRLRSISEGLISFVFPSHCLHCQDKVSKERLLCANCSFLMEMARKDHPLFIRAFEPEGPALSLLRAAEEDGRVEKALGAFMALSLEKEEHPCCIVPWPEETHLSSSLAKTVSSFLGIPVLKPFRWYRGWKRSACLSERFPLVIAPTFPDKEEALNCLNEACPSSLLFLSFC